MAVGTDDDVGAVEAEGTNQPVLYGQSTLAGQLKVVGIATEEVRVPLQDTVHFRVPVNEHPEFHEPEPGVLLEFILVKLKEEVTGKGGPALVQLIDIEVQVAPQFGVSLHQAVFFQSISTTNCGILEEGIRVGEICGDTAFLDNHPPFRNFGQEGLITPEFPKAGLYLRGLEGLKQLSVFFADPCWFEWFKRYPGLFQVGNYIDLRIIKFRNEFFYFSKEICSLLRRSCFLVRDLGSNNLLGKFLDRADLKGLGGPVKVREFQKEVETPEGPESDAVQDHRNTHGQENPETEFPPAGTPVAGSPAAGGVPSITRIHTHAACAV